MKRTGFTLIELLVVVSIIALLVSILLPALSRARAQAKVAVCSSQLHQYLTCMITYAADNEGYLPLHDGVGSHVHDLSLSLVAMMVRDYGLNYMDFLFCPAAAPGAGDETIKYIEDKYNWPRDSWDFYSNPPSAPPVYLSSYALWSPRKVTSSSHVGVFYLPPSPKSPSGYLLANGTNLIHGPRRMTDRDVLHNPVMTDDTVTDIPRSYLVTSEWNLEDNQEDFLRLYVNHMGNKNAFAVNEAFIDGHVDSLKPNEVYPRFAYGRTVDGIACGRWMWW
ncbi:MAG: type II secretion system protein [Sedimentisphaerales bacterium]|nr:type II secretion system protein [Sedimentisphaerales bacterium]